MINPKEVLMIISIMLWFPILTSLIYFQISLIKRPKEDADVRKRLKWVIRTYTLGLIAFSVGSFLIIGGEITIYRFREWISHYGHLALGTALCIIGLSTILFASLGRPSIKLGSSFVSLIGILIGVISLIIEIIALIGV